MKHSIHRLHVVSIMSILIEELIKDLMQGKDIKIPNFGTFRLKELKPKKIKNITTKEIKFARRTNALRFRLTRKLSRYLSKRSLEEMKKSVEICEENQEQ